MPLVGNKPVSTALNTTDLLSIKIRQGTSAVLIEEFTNSPFVDSGYNFDYDERVESGTHAISSQPRRGQSCGGGDRCRERLATPTDWPPSI